MANLNDMERCSFCNRTAAQVDRLFQAPASGVNICNECVSYCLELMQMDSEIQASRQAEQQELLRPAQIKAKLDELEAIVKRT